MYIPELMLIHRPHILTHPILLPCPPQVRQGARRGGEAGEAQQAEGAQGGVPEAAGGGRAQREVVLQRLRSQVQQGRPLPQHREDARAGEPLRRVPPGSASSGEGGKGG